MTTTAGHSFYKGPIASFYNQVNDTGSWEPLVTVVASSNFSGTKTFNDILASILFISLGGHWNNSIFTIAFSEYTNGEERDIMIINFPSLLFHHVEEWVSDSCLTPNEELFSYIIVRTKLYSMKWCLVCTRPTRLIGLKQHLAGRHVHPFGHLIPNQPVFAVTP